MKQKYIACGKITSTHGVRGMVRIQPWCDSVEFLEGFKTLYLSENKKPVSVDSIKPHGTVAIAKIRGIDTVEDAELLRNQILYLDRADYKLDEGRYFIEDLIGCKVLDADSGIAYGTLTDVIPGTGSANDIWTVADDNKKEYLVPAIHDVIVDIDIDNEIITIRPMKGIFDDAN